MTFSIIGLGGRGYTYAGFIREYGKEIVAICEPDPGKRDAVASLGVAKENWYRDEEEFFSAGKLSDVLVIATLDDLHYREAMRALELGYDILLEKPIAMTLSECEELGKKAVALGRRVIVCHVLRYAPLFVKLKELCDEGILGNINCIEVTENIGYYHFAHSFCRGNWRNNEVSAPLIVAKNCHDTDLILWLMNERCVSVSSYGDLVHFRRENAPEGSAERCVECRYRNECIYSAPMIYMNEEYENKARLRAHGKLGNTEEELEKNLSDRNNLYGRCVYRCDNDVVDMQIVNMRFESGAIGQLKTIAFTNKLTREVRLYGSKGILYIADGERKIVFEPLGGEVVWYPAEDSKEGGGHSGGDGGIVRSLIDYLENGKRSIGVAEIEESVDGYRVAFLAEKSRLEDGKVQRL